MMCMGVKLGKKPIMIEYICMFILERSTCILCVRNIVLKWRSCFKILKVFPSTTKTFFVLELDSKFLIIRLPEDPPPPKKKNYRCKENDEPSRIMARTRLYQYLIDD